MVWSAPHESRAAAGAKNASGLATFGSVRDAIDAILLCNYGVLSMDGHVHTVRLTFSTSKGEPPHA